MYSSQMPGNPPGYPPSGNPNPRAHWDLVDAGVAFSLYTLFSFPVLAAFSMSYDENVKYWIGTYMFWWVLPIPIWFLVHWFIQSNMTKPKRSLVMASFIVPCVVFFCVGNSVRSRAEHVMDHITYDCDWYEDTRALVKSHAEAEKYYKECHPAGGKSGFDVLFQSCPKYKEWRKEGDHKRTWDYLQYLETNYACTGFCNSAEESLWSHKEYHDNRSTWDACYNVVYSVMLSKVARGGLVMMIYPIFVLTGFLVWTCLVRPTFQKLAGNGGGHFTPEAVAKAQEVAGFAQQKAHNAYGAMQEGWERAAPVVQREAQHAKVAMQHGLERAEQKIEQGWERAAPVIRQEAQQAYGAMQHGLERVEQKIGQMYSPRQPMPPAPPQPVFVPASEPMAAPGPASATLPPGQPISTWSAPPAPGYANPQMPPMQK